MNKINLTDSDFEVKDKRIVRSKFSINGEGEVCVYEPTNMDVKELKKLMEEKGSYQFNTKEIFDVLIHRFTNLDTSKISETVRYKLMESQPLWLSRVCAEIQLVVSEIVSLQAIETKEMINRVNNMSHFVEFMGAYDKDTIKQLDSIDIEEMKKALENLSEDEKVKLKTMLSEMNKV